MLRISGGFLLLAAWFAAVNGWKMLGIVLSAVVIHEGGHWLALRMLGAAPRRLQAGVLGLVMELDSRRLSYGGELAAVLAGPCANILCACLLTAVHPTWDTAVGAQVVLGGFNLLPVRPLDGGRALYLLGSWLFGPDRGEWIVRMIGGLTAFLCGAGLLWLMRWTGGSLWLLPAAGGMLAAGGREWFGKRTFL